MYRVEVLPAEYGDALWVEYGPTAAPRRLLIDCGTPRVYDQALEERILRLPKGGRRLELLVITHIDADHIGGAVKLLRNRQKLGLELGDVWFNGFDHLLDDGVRGPMQGEQLSFELRRQKLPWNAAFGGRAVVVPDAGALPVKRLASGMKLTLLSPYRRQLAELRLVWDKVIREAGLVPGRAIADEEASPRDADDLPRGRIDVGALARSRFEEDTAEANGSSIAFLAKHQGRTVLFGADAHASVLLRSLKTLNVRGLRLDALKVAHHGSEHNVSLELLGALRCTDYLISTNSKRFRHPSPAGIARIVSRKGATVYFNYRTQFNQIWDDSSLKRKHGYMTVFPPDPAKAGIVLEL